jgi:hypothetical protein
MTFEWDIVIGDNDGRLSHRGTACASSTSSHTIHAHANRSAVNKQPAGFPHVLSRMPHDTHQARELVITFGPLEKKTQDGGRFQYPLILYDASGGWCRYNCRISYLFDSAHDLNRFQIRLNQDRVLETFWASSIKVMWPSGSQKRSSWSPNEFHNVWLSISEGIAHDPDPIVSVLRPGGRKNAPDRPLVGHIKPWDMQDPTIMERNGLKIYLELSDEATDDPDQPFSMLGT